MGKKLEYKVQRKKFGPKRNEVRGSGEDYLMRSFVMCAAHQILLGLLKQEE